MNTLYKINRKAYIAKYKLTSEPSYLINYSLSILKLVNIKVPNTNNSSLKLFALLVNPDISDGTKTPADIGINYLTINNKFTASFEITDGSLPTDYEYFIK